MLDFSISILSDGTIEYKKNEYINLTNSKKKITEADLGRLIDEFIDIYFFALNDEYIQNKVKMSSRIEISVNWQNKHKKVIFEENSSNVPTKLVEFQKLINKTLEIS